MYTSKGAALRTNDFDGCESYLNTLDDVPQANALWQQLANKAMELGDLNVIFFYFY